MKLLKLISFPTCLILLTLMMGVQGCSKEDTQKVAGQVKEIATQVNATSDVTENTGRMVINTHFDSAREFSEGLASVGIGARGDRKYGFIDKKKGKKKGSSTRSLMMFLISQGGLLQ